MRRALVTAFAASALVIGLGLNLAGCATLPRVVGAETAQRVELTSLKAAKTALVVWSIAQQSVLVYGRMPNCDPELPDLKFCKEPKVWAQIKKVEAQTTAVVLAARPLVEAGTDDVAFLIGVAAAVNEGVIAINKARGIDGVTS